MDVIYSLLVPQEGELISASTRMEDSSSPEMPAKTLWKTGDHCQRQRTSLRLAEHEIRSMQAAITQRNQSHELLDTLMINWTPSKIEKYEPWLRLKASVGLYEDHEHKKSRSVSSIDARTGHHFDCELSVLPRPPFQESRQPLEAPSNHAAVFSLAQGSRSGVVQRFYRECEAQGIAPIFQFEKQSCGKFLANVRIGPSHFTLQSPKQTQQLAHDAVCEKAFDEVHVWHRDCSFEETVYDKNSDRMQLCRRDNSAQETCSEKSLDEMRLSHLYPYAMQAETTKPKVFLLPSAAEDCDEDWTALLFEYTQKNKQAPPSFEILRTTDQEQTYFCRVLIKEFPNVPFDSTLHRTTKEAKAGAAKVAIEWLRKQGKAMTHKYKTLEHVTGQWKAIKCLPRRFTAYQHPFNPFLLAPKRMFELARSLGIREPLVSVRKSRPKKYDAVASFFAADKVSEPLLDGSIGLVKDVKARWKAIGKCCLKVIDVLEKIRKNRQDNVQQVNHSRTDPEHSDERLSYPRFSHIRVHPEDRTDSVFSGDGSSST